MHEVEWSNIVREYVKAIHVFLCCDCRCKMTHMHLRSLVIFYPSHELVYNLWICWYFFVIATSKNGQKPKKKKKQLYIVSESKFWLYVRVRWIGGILLEMASNRYTHAIVSRWDETKICVSNMMYFTVHLSGRWSGIDQQIESSFGSFDFGFRVIWTVIISEQTHSN